MRFTFVLSVCFLLSYFGFSQQKHDYHIYHKASSTIGSGIHMYYVDSLADVRFEVFEWDSAFVVRAPTLSDANGKFLGYFNAVRLYDSLGRVAINGDSMSVGFYQSFINQFNHPDVGTYIEQNAAFIPISDSLFYLFHQTVETDVGQGMFELDVEEMGYKLNGYSYGLYLTKVKLRPDGRLEILKGGKKIQLIDDLLILNQLSFCKHANGKDWWIITPKVPGPEAYVLLLRDGEILETKEIYFSENNNRVNNGSGLTFSPDGTKFVRLLFRPIDGFSQILEFYDFDRCTGTFENTMTTTFPLPEAYTPVANVEFSESGRFLYIAFGEFIVQYDLELVDFIQHPDTIARWDGFAYANINPPLFDSMLRLPNGKIIVGSFVSTPFLHYIHQPDSAGNACDFEQRALMMPLDSLNLPFYVDFEGFPRFPPYRMEALDVDCTTPVREVVEQTKQLRVYPNPASSWLKLSEEIHGLSYRVMDVLGRELRVGEVQGGLLDVSELPGGSYFLEVKGYEVVKFVKL